MQKKYITSAEAKILGHTFIDMEAEKLKSHLREKSKKLETYA